MKRKILCLFATAMMILAGSATVFAGGHGHGRNHSTVHHRLVVCQFVDKNDDGICDNRGSCGHSNFVDKDGDGICDNHASRPACGQGRGHGCHGRSGRGCR